MLSFRSTPFRGLYSGKQLPAFTSSVFDKGFNILLETVNSLFHLFVKLLRSLQACLQICVGLIHFSISAQDRISLTREGLVLVLFRSYALVLEQFAVVCCKLLHKRALLVVGLQNAVLMCTKLLKFLLEELRFLVRDRFLVQNEDVADIVVVNLDRLVSICTRCVEGQFGSLPFPSNPSATAFSLFSPIAAFA